MSLLVTKKITLRTLFVTGILMAIASSIRLNLAYVTVLIGLFAMFAIKPRSLNCILQRGLVYAAGSCLVVLLTYIPYLITGYQKLWFSTVILAPLNYANSQLSELEILGTYLTNNHFGSKIIISLGLIELSLIFIRLIKAFKKKILEKNLELICLFLFFFGTMVSIFKGGAAHNHYLIQLVPFIALITAFYLSNFLRKPICRLKTSVIIFVIGLIKVLIILEYNSLISRYITTKKLTYGSAYEIAAYLQQENATQKPIYLMKDHIVYWLIDSQPLTKFSTHPSNITKDYLFNKVLDSDSSSEGEMNKILAQKPQFIVTVKNIWYLKDRPQAKLLLENTLEQDYELVKKIKEKQIYRIKVMRMHEKSKM